MKKQASAMVLIMIISTQISAQTSSYFENFMKKRDLAIGTAELTAADQYRKRSITELEELLTGDVRGELRAQVLKRLAHLYLEQGQFRYAEEKMIFEELAPENSDVLVDHRASLQALKKAVQTLKQIITSYPKSRYAEDALFVLGAFFFYRGEPAAKFAFEKLLEDFPESRFVARAHYVLGDLHFQAARYQSALQHFQAIVRDKDSRLRIHAVYKLGWLYYNISSENPKLYQTRITQAVETWRQVLQLIKKNPELQMPPYQELTRQVRYDLLRIWAELGKVAFALDFISGDVPHRDRPGYMQRFGEELENVGNRHSAQVVFQLILAQFPQYSGNLALLAKVIAHKFASGSCTDGTLQLVQGLQRFANGHPLESADTAKLTPHQGDFDLLAMQAYEYARQFYERKPRSQQHLRCAQLIAGTLRKLRPNNKVGVLGTFLLAVIYEDAKKFVLAARLYDEVRRNSALAERQGFHREAWLAAIYAWHAASEREPANLKALIQQSTAFLLEFPDDDMSPAVAFERANSLARLGEIDSARLQLEAIVSRYPTTLQAEQARATLADAPMAGRVNQSQTVEISKD